MPTTETTNLLESVERIARKDTWEEGTLETIAQEVAAHAPLYRAIDLQVSRNCIAAMVSNWGIERKRAGLLLKTARYMAAL